MADVLEAVLMVLVPVETWRALEKIAALSLAPVLAPALEVGACALRHDPRPVDVFEPLPKVDFELPIQFSSPCQSSLLPVVRPTTAAGVSADRRDIALNGDENTTDVTACAGALGGGDDEEPNSPLVSELGPHSLTEALDVGECIVIDVACASLAVRALMPALWAVTVEPEVGTSSLRTLLLANTMDAVICGGVYGRLLVGSVTQALLNGRLSMGI